jgi:hypothetical protein
MPTLENLEQRLNALEEEVSRLKVRLNRDPSPNRATDESLGARLIRQAEEGHADLVAGWKKFMAELGIHGQPIGAKKLRAMLIEQGINPEDNAFSREIIAMREE